jgi:Txe/YoeB family toxin of toxin-antitoxin system
LVTADPAWRVVFTNQAQKDARKLNRAGLRPKAERLLKLLREDPVGDPLPFEELVCDLAGAFSRRISIRHRLVYQVLEKEQVVKVLRMWTHYE